MAGRVALEFEYNSSGVGTRLVRLTEAATEQSSPASHTRPAEPDTPSKSRWPTCTPGGPAAEQRNRPEIVPELEWRRREIDNLKAALEASRGRVYGAGGAAELLDVKATTLVSRLQALGLRRTPASGRVLPAVERDRA